MPARVTNEDFRRFAGTAGYIASEALIDAVNCAVALERPLLIKGEPGTGKTLLARHVASALGMPMESWHIKSTTKAADGLYVYDTVQRLNDSRFGGGDVADIRRYIRFGPLGRVFNAPNRHLLLIDEVDKADVEFPNDLLHELDAMSFFIPETNRRVDAVHRPIVVITSNSEKELPDAFLRRCVFHYIEFPNPELMTRIVGVHFDDLPGALLRSSLDAFYRLREIDGLRKRPSTSELIDWIAALLAHGVDEQVLEKEVPFVGVLLKREQDLAQALKRLQAKGKAFGTGGRWS